MRNNRTSNAPNSVVLKPKRAKIDNIANENKVVNPNMILNFLGKFTHNMREMINPMQLTITNKGSMKFKKSL